MKFRAIIACAAALAAMSASADAQGQPKSQDEAASNTATSPDVNLTPRRLVFGPNDRGVKEITVFNRTNKTATYTIVLLDQVMTPEGALVDPDKAPAGVKAGFKSATDWIRYSPRQMTLGANEAQTVRVQARRPADAPPGEYRTHFSVSATPPPDTGTDISAAASGVEAKELQIKLTPVYGIMIPIIVRNGDLDAQATLANAKFVQANGRKAVQVTVNRTGGRSLYGTFDVFLVGNGAQKRIGGLRGLGVYPELDHRVVTLPIDADAAGVGPGSRVKIVYTDDEFKPGAVLAETEATLS